MRGWHSLALGDALTAHMSLDSIRDAYEAQFPAAGRPPDAAVFARYDHAGLHCDVTVFFSPLTEPLAIRFGARPGKPPVPMGLELLAGDACCWHHCFGQSSHEL
jgi:hypothetical protein